MTGGIARLLRRFARDQGGASSLLLIFGASTMIGTAAIAVDLGTLYLAKRQMQGLADASVLAAVEALETDGEAEARRLLDLNGAEDVVIARYERGTYLRSAAVAHNARFTPTVSSPTAARLTLSRAQPLYFARLLTGRAATQIAVEAIAAREDKAAFSIGSRLGAISGGLPNALLSALAGSDLQLEVSDIGNLQTTTIELLNFADALRIRLGLDGSTYGELFEEDVAVATVLLAMSDIAPDPASQTMLSDLAGRLGGQTLRLVDLIDLGPLAQTDVNDGTGAISLDALTLLRASLEAASGSDYSADVTLALPGISSTRLRLAGGAVTARSPLMTVTGKNDVVISTARTRLYVETRIGLSTGSIASITVPFFVEIAEASARLSALNCSDPNAGATLGVTPSIGSAAIASVDAGALDEFTAPLARSPAVLVNLAGTTVSAFAEAELGGASEQSVFFSKADIDAGTVHSVATGDITSALASSLLENTEITVTTPLGLGLGLAPTSGAIATQIGTITPQVDLLINQVTALMGVRLGIADVQVNRMRCGMATLVS